MIKAIADIAVLIKVVVKRKRRELFIILVPSLDLVANIAGGIGSYMMLQNSSDWDNLPGYTIGPSVFFAINNFTFMMSHQIFGAQYLKTSFVLPRLFNQAKLEWLLQEPRREKIQSQKHLYFRTGHLTLDRINHATDNIIKEHK